MAGGAIIGASTGAKADRRAKEDVHDHYEKVQQRKARERRNQSGYDNYNQTDDYAQPNRVDGSGFDSTNSGDDPIWSSSSAAATTANNVSCIGYRSEYAFIATAASITTRIHWYDYFSIA